MIVHLYEMFTNLRKINEANEAEDLAEVKDIIFIKAVETNDIKIIEFFLNKGYNIDTEDALYKACFNDETFRFMLSKGADVNELPKMQQLDRINIQKALIDYGHEVYVHDVIGFNKGLKDDEKYSDLVKRFDDIGKYNL